MKYFGKFIKNNYGQQLDLTSDVGYNNTMTNLGKIFDYSWFKEYPEHKITFEWFIDDFNKWLNQHGVDTYEYKNKEFDVNYYLKEFVEDPNSPKDNLKMFYKEVYDAVKKDMDWYENNSQYWADNYSEFTYEFLSSEREDDIRDTVENEFHDEEVDIDEILEYIYDNERDCQVYTSWDDDIPDNLVTVYDLDLSYSEESVSLRTSVPYNENSDYARELGEDSIYWDWSVRNDYAYISPSITIYYMFDRDELAQAGGISSLDGLETLFNSRLIKSSDEYYYHSTRQRGLNKFENKTTSDKAKTGEGAMVHGWGLYVQANKQLNIENYKKSLSRESVIQPDTIEVDGKVAYFDRKDEIWHGVVKDESWFDSLPQDDYEYLDFTNLEKLCFTTLLVEGSLESVLTKLKENIGNTDFPKYEMFPDAIKFYESHKFGKIKPRHKDLGVSQYKVKIPDTMVFINDGEYVDEELINRLVENSNGNLRRDDFDEEISGEKLYRTISQLLGGDEKASEFLMMNGIDGKKYHGGLDGDCCVIFNCEKLEIVEED